MYTPAPLSTHSFPVGTEKMARLELMLIYQALMRSFKQKKDSEFTLGMPVPHPHNCLNLYHLEEEAVRKPLSPSSWVAI